MMNPTRPDACLSDFALDRRLGGELGAGEEPAAARHIASCTRCERRWIALRSERDAFAREAPALDLGARPSVRPRRGPRRLGASVGALAAAAAVAMFFWSGASKSPGVRSKGSAFRLGFYVKHAGVVREGGPGERVQPGDALRFFCRTSEGRYVAVISKDGAGRASTYYPASGAPPRREPGDDGALPLSTVLDDALGEETIYGLACRQPFDAEALRRDLERAPARPLPLPPGCDVDVITLHKEAPLPKEPALPQEVSPRP